MDLTGKKALITGASRGIGKAIALELAASGADVGVNYTSNETMARAVCEEIESQGRRALPLQANVADEDQVGQMVDAFVGEFGTVDIFVNNAGIVHDCPILMMKAQDFARVVEVNLFGAFLCLKAVGRHMLRRKYGRVVTISSINACTGNVGQASYSASKAGVIALTKTFAKEFARRDITANAITPGLIDTDMAQSLDEQIKEKIVSLIPKGRMGTVEEVAYLVKFLASEESRYITGQVFSVNGGILM